ncbi:MAG: hypothetical protein R6V19_10705 [Armatimonadota bacterium]
MEADFIEGMGAIAGVWLIVGIMVALVLGLLWLVVAIWVGFDASGRRQPGFPWFLLTFSFFPVGLTAWLIVRAFLPTSR